MPVEKYQLKSKAKTRRLVLRYIALKKEVSASDTARALKITLPTVNSCFEYFTRKKYIQKAGVKQGGLGRKSQMWEYIAAERLTMGAEILPGTIRAAVHNLKGDIFYEHFQPYRSGGELLGAFTALLEGFSALLPKEVWASLKEIGVAVAGTVDFKRKKILYSSNIGVENIDFQEIEAKFKKTILLENNANAGALGEYFLGADLLTMLFISISPQGVGGGLFMEGKLQKGHTRRGGEIGHMSIDINGIPCPCGNKGCLERYISEQGFLTIARKHGIEAQQPTDVFQNPARDAALQEYSYYLGKGLRNLMFIFDPSLIVIGGFVSRHWGQFGPLIESILYEDNPLFSVNKALHIRGAKFEQNSSLIGAGLLPYYKLFYDDEVFN